MPRFEINFLDENTDEALLAEIQRVAASFSGASLSKRLFVKLSGRVSASTICKRSGGWREALETAGVGHLYNGLRVTDKMRKNRISREMSESDLVAELHRVQLAVGRNILSVEEFNRLSVIGVGAVRGKFGTWQKALAAAGISQSNHAKRYSDEECFENLAAVWTHYGRVPQYLEMNQSPWKTLDNCYWKKASRCHDRIPTPPLPTPT
jgi:Homing endonuclease associated repeat